MNTNNHIAIERQERTPGIIVGNWNDHKKPIFYNNPMKESDIWLKKEILLKNSINLEGRSNSVTGYKEIHKEICQYLGPSFNKRLRAISNDVWITPYKYYIDKYCFYSSGFDHYYSSPQVKRLWKHLNEVRLADNDGIENIVPYIIYFGASPHKLRRLFGKSIWKRLCQYSRTTNKTIVRHMDNVFLTDTRYGAVRNYDKYYPILEKLVVLKPGTIKYLGDEVPSFMNRGRFNHIFYGSFIWAQNNSRISMTHEFIRASDLYRDTLDMAHNINAPFNDRWSYKRMARQHNAYSRELYNQNYPDEKIDWILPFSRKVKCTNEISACVLETPRAIALEGDEMGHCVASFIDEVINGLYLVISLKRNEERSTLGLYRAKRNSLFIAHQHYGRYNATPSDNNVDIAKLVIKTINLIERMEEHAQS